MKQTLTGQASAFVQQYATYAFTRPNVDEYGLVNS